MASLVSAELVEAYLAKVAPAIRETAEAHPQELFSSFGFYADPGNGIFAAGLDTCANSLLHAKQQEKHVEKIRKLGLDRDGIAYCNDLARDASCLRIDDFNNSFSNMKFPGIFHEYVEEWLGNPAVTTGFVLLLAWRVSERLLEANAFAPLNLASPFRLCFSSMEREDMVVFKILNWPPQVGPAR